MNQDLQNLPDEVLEAMGRPERENSETLQALGRKIAGMRDEAIKARSESGIETTWLDCEAQFLGCDNLNRHEFDGARWAKPMTMDGPLTKTSESHDDTRATAFVPETRRYVMAGHAKVCEIALPMDGKPFTLKATPAPEMSELADNDMPAQAITQQPMPGHDGQPVKVSDLAKHAIDKAEKAAEKAATRIADWMVEYKHQAEMRKVIFDGARIGVGVLKGPIPETRRSVSVRRGMPPADPMGADVMAQHPIPRAPGGISIEIVEKIKPAARWIDPWCFYPAPGCGEDIHNGSHTFECDPMLENELVDLKDQGFDQEAIDRVIAEGPGKCYVTDARNNNDRKQDRKRFEVWHFYGRIPRVEFEAANSEQASEVEKARDTVYVIVTLVNDTVIRAVLNPLDTGRLPYHVFTWSRRAGHWAGVGVAEQVSTPQIVLNSATRAMLNNAAKSAGAHVVMDDDAVEPAAAGDYRLGVGDKLWLLRKGSGMDDVRKAFASFVWPNTTQQLMIVIDFALKMFEEASSIPLITQGQSGKTTPDTFSGQQLQDNNANQLLREVGFALNDQITTPLVDQMYEWLLLDPDIPDDEKGDYQVDTSGALAMIEKALNDQMLPLLVQMSVNPAYGLNPKLCMEGAIRARRMVPSQWQYTEAELDQQSQHPPPKAPAVEAAEIRANAQVKVAESHDALLAEKTRVDTDRDTMLVQSQARRDASLYELRLEELRLKRDLALMEYAKDERLNLQDAKVKLASDTMKLTLQRELAGADGKGPQVATPAVEPEGRAQEGEAYQA